MSEYTTDDFDDNTELKWGFMFAEALAEKSSRYPDTPEAVIAEVMEREAEVIDQGPSDEVAAKQDELREKMGVSTSEASDREESVDEVQARLQQRILRGD